MLEIVKCIQFKLHFEKHVFLKKKKKKKKKRFEHFEQITLLLQVANKIKTYSSHKPWIFINLIQTMLAN